MIINLFVYTMMSLVILYVIAMIGLNYFLVERVNRLRRSIYLPMALFGLFLFMLSIGHFTSWLEGNDGIPITSLMGSLLVFFVVCVLFAMVMYFNSVRYENKLREYILTLPEGSQREKCKRLLEKIETLEGKYPNKKTTSNIDD